MKATLALALALVAALAAPAAFAEPRQIPAVEVSPSTLRHAVDPLDGRAPRPLATSADAPHLYYDPAAPVRPPRAAAQADIVVPPRTVNQEAR